MATGSKVDTKHSTEGTEHVADPNIITSETLSSNEYAPAYYAQKWWRRPISQIILVSFVCFMCPGELAVVVQNRCTKCGGIGQVCSMP